MISAHPDALEQVWFMMRGHGSMISGQSNLLVLLTAWLS
jgi:hypothetical protein